MVTLLAVQEQTRAFDGNNESFPYRGKAPHNPVLPKYVPRG